MFERKALTKEVVSSVRTIFVIQAVLKRLLYKHGRSQSRNMLFFYYENKCGVSGFVHTYPDKFENG